MWERLTLGGITSESDMKKAKQKSLTKIINNYLSMDKLTNTKEVKERIEIKKKERKKEI